MIASLTNMRYLYLIILCFFISKVSLAQGTDSRQISVNFQQANIEQIVNDLESKTGYHFYYDPIAFDSLRVTLQINQQPLKTILDNVFKDTRFHYSITAQQEVLLTKDRIVQTNLAGGFFDTTAKPIQIATAVPGFTTNEKENKIPEATVENKTYEIGIKTNQIGTGNATMAGYVKGAKTGESIIGASLYIANLKTGVSTDEFGFYSITLPKGKHTITIRSIGNRDTYRQVLLYSDGKLNIDLQEQIQSLKEVKISATKVANVRGLQMGTVKLDIKSIKEIPAVFGEADVLRAMLALPGEIGRAHV